MLEARIYVGLRDKDSREQHYETDRYKAVLREICKDFRTPFSVQVMEGGYHDMPEVKMYLYNLLPRLWPKE